MENGWIKKKTVIHFLFRDKKKKKKGKCNPVGTNTQLDLFFFFLFSTNLKDIELLRYLR